MSTAPPLLRLIYEKAADAYALSLPPEHYMEATAQATQRKITLESLDLVHARRPEVQIFNELLVQYPVGRRRQPGQVVPDNMVVVWKEPIRATGSFDVPFQPVLPLLVLEYVSKHSKRKDYEESRDKYERELKVPYYLIFYPDNAELTLFHRGARRYRSVPPNDQGRHPITELDLEVAILDGWVRYWYEGSLLPLPGDLQRDLDESRRQLEIAVQQAKAATQEAQAAGQRADAAGRRADAAEREMQRLRSELEALRLRSADR